ncbi:hypothetical protein DV738_g2629, partial [Chaetothyriales sp. CBS 135597]
MATDMLSVVAPTYTDPSKYELIRLPVPELSEPTDVQIEVHAASINPIDVKKASGMLKMAMQDEFPYKIGFDAAGVVTKVGSGVTKFKAGDEVYVRLPETGRGSWAEYAKCEEFYIAQKPKSLDFADSASLPLAAMTSLQALQKYKGSLEGKTVFVPAGLSGTGAYACQLAKNVFHAGKVITTVSTSKVPKVPELLGKGVVDQIIDYTKENPATVIPRGSVDFILDTTGESMQFLSLMVASTSSIVSISTLPSGTQLQQSPLMQRSDKPQLSWLAYLGLNALDSVRKLRARRWGVEYQYMFLEATGKDLEAIAGYVDTGLIKPVVGTRANFKDIESKKQSSKMGIFIYAPASFTEKDVPDLSGKVFIVTGATSGVGESLVGILYSKHAKVYLAARSASKADKTIHDIKTQHPTSKGQLVFLHLDLNDLSTIKTSANEFLAKESKLDVLWNNAAVMAPPQGSKTVQGYEQQLGTNNLGHFLFTKLLTPLLKAAAKTEPIGSVRVVWVASSAAANFAPKGGIVMDNLDYKTDNAALVKYGISKAGNILQAAEYARRVGSDNNIVSVSLDPGNLKTDLYRTIPKWQMPFINLFLKDAIYGAYTELFAGLSPQVQLEHNGRFIEPWGKIGYTRSDIEDSRKAETEGGNGIAAQFYDWNEQQVAPYA